MKPEPKTSRPIFQSDAMASLIADTQTDTGEIPWSPGDKTDPWDHVESAMGLNLTGRREAAEAAFRWLTGVQMEDGSWYASYRNGEPDDRTRDTNMTTYLAVGLYHHWLLHRDRRFVEEIFPAVARGMDFALTFQTPGGELHWAASPEGVVDPMALLTGSSSVYMSLKCALSLAGIMDVARPDWAERLGRLGNAIRHRRPHFNLAKSRFSMDWFYPILCGALTGPEAQRRIEKYWDKFVIEGRGVRCVSDEPWVTIAETSELVLALTGMGNETQARIVFHWIQDCVFEDGTFWAGFTVPETIVWPGEKLTWTNAAVLLAADALDRRTPAHHLFNHRFWAGSELAPYL